METERAIEHSQFLTQPIDRRTFLKRLITGGAMITASPLVAACTAENNDAANTAAAIRIYTGKARAEDEVNELKSRFSHVSPDQVALYKNPGFLNLSKIIWLPKMARITPNWIESGAKIDILTEESEAPILGGHKPRAIVTTLNDQPVKLESLDVQAAMNVFPARQLTEESRLLRTVIIGVDSGSLFRFAGSLALEGLRVYFEIDRPASFQVSEDSKRKYELTPGPNQK